ncbi:MAG: hypothetical protein IJV88_00710 [Ruminococcus sp.]|nr:hypothetical protein [Ruminococcus sp.]
MTSAFSLRVTALTCVLLVVLSLLSIAIVSADGVEFVLSDVYTLRGRLFETELTAQEDFSVSAFVARLEYDPELIEYRNVSVYDDGANFSVSTLSPGVISVAVVYDEPSGCSATSGIMSVGFKALAAETSQILLTVEDVLDPQGQDAEAPVCTGATVSVTCSAAGSDTDSANPDHPDLTSYDADELVFIEGAMVDRSLSSGKKEGASLIPRISADRAVSIAAALLVLGAVCIAGYTGYKLGFRGAINKKKGSVPLEMGDPDAYMSDYLSEEERLTNEENT